jgi:hypothetical protein
MKLKVESSTSEREYEIDDISKLKDMIGIAMKEMQCEDCVFQLNGSAGFYKVVGLDCLFG